MGSPFAAIVLPLLVRPSLSPLSLVVLFLTIAVYTSLNWTTGFVHAGLAGLSPGGPAGHGAPGVAIHCRGWCQSHPGDRHLGLRQAEDLRQLRGIPGRLPLGKRGLWSLSDDRPGSGAPAVCSRRGPPAAAPGARLPLRSAFREEFGETLGLFPAPGCGSLRGRCHAQLLRDRALDGRSRVLGGFGAIHAADLGREERRRTASETAPGRRVLPQAAFLAGCFVYALAVTVLASLHDSECRAMVTLVRTNTARSDTIVVAETDPKLASISGGVADFTDRRVVVQRDLSLGEPLAGRAFLLSTSGEVKLPLVATTSQPSLVSWPVVQKLLAWYRVAVARRLPGDQGFRPGTCYLYELVSANRAANLQASPAKPARPM